MHAISTAIPILLILGAILEVIPAPRTLRDAATKTVLVLYLTGITLSGILLGAAAWHETSTLPLLPRVLFAAIAVGTGCIAGAFAAVTITMCLSDADVHHKHIAH